MAAARGATRDTAMSSAETDSFLVTSRLRLTPFYRPAAPGLLLAPEEFSERIAAAAHSRGISLLVMAQDGADSVQRWIEQGADGVVLARP